MLIVDATARRKMQKLMDPAFFIPRFMWIVDKHGVLSRFNNLREEQLLTIEYFKKHNNLLALKSRQLGITTVALALFLHRALFSGDQYNVLSVAHDMDAMYRCNQMLKVFWTNLPDIIKPKAEKWAAKELSFAHNGTLFKQTMAGGRSQGRSYTYQGSHWTEMGLYPRGSSAHSGEGGVDEAVYASVMATVHENQHTRNFIESTANGPIGVFYKRVKVARENPEWGFLFFPWHRFQAYRREPPPDWERTDEESELAALYDLDDHQLAWRRWKVQDGGLHRFRKEYPINWEEPFMPDEQGTWFNLDNMNRMLAGVRKELLDVKSGARIFEDPIAHRKYFIGMDPSGGVGRDAGTIQVLRDDWKQVLTYSSREQRPSQLAELCAKIGTMYNKAKILCEENNHGKAALRELRKLGYSNLALTEKGKDFWVDRPLKRVMYSHARDVVDAGYTDISDPFTIQEMMHVREQADGNIEADEGYNDDHVSALVLALWCARHCVSVTAEKTVADRIHQQRTKRHRELGL